MQTAGTLPDAIEAVLPRLALHSLNLDRGRAESN
jgi:hypothetical protein